MSRHTMKPYPRDSRAALSVSTLPTGVTRTVTTTSTCTSTVYDEHGNGTTVLSGSGGTAEWWKADGSAGGRGMQTITRGGKTRATVGMHNGHGWKTADLPSGLSPCDFPAFTADAFGADAFAASHWGTSAFGALSLADSAPSATCRSAKSHRVKLLRK